jgi:hypothetical protein
MRTAATHLDAECDYRAYLGGSETTYKTSPASSYSASQVSFNVNPPSPQIIVDRHVMIKCRVQVVLNGTPAAGARLYQSGYDAFRQYPISSVISNLQLGLNNTTITEELSEIVHEQRLCEESLRDQALFSTAPCYPDQSQEYDQLINTNRNPLAQYGEMGRGTPFRGAFNLRVIAGNAPDETTATLEADITEPLFISPLLWGRFEQKGLYGVQNMNVVINWLSDLSRMWSSANSSAVNAVAVSFSAPPELLFKYITPSAGQALNDLKSLDYNFERTDVYKSQSLAFTAGQEQQMISPNIQLNVVPKYLMIFAKEQQSDRNFNTTDSWLSLESLRITFANNPSNFVGADKRELYQVCVRNGMDVSYPSWSGEDMPVGVGADFNTVQGRGSVFICAMGRDLSWSDPAIAPGVPGTFNLQVQGQFTNRKGRDVNAVLYVCPVFSGILRIAGNQAIQSNAVLSQEDVLRAQKSANAGESLHASEAEGGFWADVLEYGRKALPYVRGARKIGQAVTGSMPMSPQAQMAKTALDVAESVGLGNGGVLTGGSVSGGKKLSKAELRKALAL